MFLIGIARAERISGGGLIGSSRREEVSEGGGRDSLGPWTMWVLCGDVAGPSTDRDSDPWGPVARVPIWVLVNCDLGFCLPAAMKKSVDFAGEIVIRLPVGPGGIVVFFLSNRWDRRRA